MDDKETIDVDVDTVPLHQLARMLAYTRNTCVVMLEIRPGLDTLVCEDVASLRETEQFGRLEILTTITVALRSMLRFAEAERSAEATVRGKTLEAVPARPGRATLDAADVATGTERERCIAICERLRKHHPALIDLVIGGILSGDEAPHATPNGT